MRASLLFSLMGLSLVGCATPSRATRDGGSFCAIEQAPWPSAASAFDRRLTLEVIGGLRQAVEADVRALHEGRRAEIGDRLTAISRAPATTAFISDGVHELAVRLRQLDCAVRADKLAVEVAARRYAGILGELSVEQATLEPKGGSINRGTAVP